MLGEEIRGEGRMEDPKARNGVVNERLLQIVSVTTQVAIHLEKGLPLRYPIARSPRGGGRVHRPTPMVSGLEPGCGLRAGAGGRFSYHGWP